MADLTILAELIKRGRDVRPHRPWPRAVVTPDVWRAATELLAQPGWAMLGLWGDRGSVHMALSNEPAGKIGVEIGVVSLDCPDRQFPSVARTHPPALHLEAAVRDLFGLQPSNSPDARPWLRRPVRRF